MFRNLPDSPPPVIPTCPTCGQPLTYEALFKKWLCGNPRCPNVEDFDAVFSLAAYEASERAKARRLAELDNAVEDDDEAEDEW